MDKQQCQSLLKLQHSKHTKVCKYENGKVGCTKVGFCSLHIPKDIIGGDKHEE